jgi:hypothetical protein
MWPLYHVTVYMALYERFVYVASELQGCICGLCITGLYLCHLYGRALLVASVSQGSICGLCITVLYMWHLYHMALNIRSLCITGLYLWCMTEPYLWPLFNRDVSLASVSQGCISGVCFLTELNLWPLYMCASES